MQILLEKMTEQVIENMEQVMEKRNVTGDTPEIFQHHQNACYKKNLR